MLDVYQHCPSRFSRFARLCNSLRKDYINNNLQGGNFAYNHIHLKDDAQQGN